MLWIIDNVAIKICHEFNVPDGMSSKNLSKELSSKAFSLWEWFFTKENVEKRTEISQRKQKKHGAKAKHYTFSLDLSPNRKF